VKNSKIVKGNQMLNNEEGYVNPRVVRIIGAILFLVICIVSLVFLEIRSDQIEAQSDDLIANNARLLAEAKPLVAALGGAPNFHDTAPKEFAAHMRAVIETVAPLETIDLENGKASGVLPMVNADGDVVICVMSEHNDGKLEAVKLDGTDPICK
jgi:hypothetical protein